MDKKRYSKTRYQNVYKNIKNKNYIVAISNPKTTISVYEGKKIYDIDIAIKIRDDYKSKIIRTNKTIHIDDFKTIWDKYIIDCEKVQKQAFNTLKKKRMFYNIYLNYFDDKRINKISKNDIVLFLEKLSITNKEKNELLKKIKAFFNWCCKNDYLVLSPATYISSYKTTKTKMKYWLPDELKMFLECVNNDILNGNNFEKVRAYLIRIFTLITFNLGDRVGETRALTFGNIDKKKKIIRIEHSINYDPNSESFYSNTKNEYSERTLDISDKLIDEIDNWKLFLEDKCKLKIKDTTPIILNLNSLKPISDTALRQKFYYYCEKASVSKIRMYDLRHTFATTMMTEGWNMYVISNRLGHKKITTTINTYGNITEDVRKEMALTTDKYY